MPGKNKVYVTLEVETDKGTKKIRRFGTDADQAFAKVKAGAQAGALQAVRMEQAWGTSINHIRNHWKAYSATVALAAGAAAAALTAGIKDAITAASDLEEVSSKFNVVFADQKANAEAMTSVLVEGYAMSTREAKQYLSSVQDLLVPMGMQSKMAGDLSFEIVKLSADLGSFNNMPTAKVMDDIQSALVGNYETMKKYGVVLNATIVQEQALAMGLASTKAELTAAHKAQAAYKLMTEGSTAAIGDMARTSGSYANQVKQLKANTEELKGLLGQELLPAITGIVSGMNSWVKENKNLIEQKIPEYVGRVETVLKKTWNIVTYDPLIVEFGLVGLVLGGRKGAALIGGVAHLAKWAETLGKASGMVAGGVLTFQEVMNSNFPQLKALVERGEQLLEGAGRPMVRGKIPAPQGGALPPTVTPQVETPSANLFEGFGDIGDVGIYTPDAIAAQQAAVMEADQAAYRARLDSLGAFHDARLEMLLIQQSLELEMEENKEALRKRIVQQGNRQALFDTLYFLREMGNHSETAFKAYKAVAIAQTVISTYKAAQDAYAAGMSVGGPLAPAIATAFAAAAVAAGVARVDAIRSQQPMGSAGGGVRAAGGGFGYTPASQYEPEWQAQNRSIMEEDKETQESRSITIHVYGNIVDHDQFAREMMDSIRKAEADGA